jgi:hypothetical protein
MSYSKQQIAEVVFKWCLVIVSLMLLFIFARWMYLNEIEAEKRKKQQIEADKNYIDDYEPIKEY